MARTAAGVVPIAGFLTSYLDDLDLSRKELAQVLGVSVRTIHNIEHGRKRVDPAILARLASALNDRSQSLYPAAEPLALTKDHFIVAPTSIVNVAMQAITLNRPDFLLHEQAQVDPALRWWINGNPDRLPWTGLFDLTSLGGQIAEFHRCFEYMGVEDTRIYLSPRHYAAVVRTKANIRHPHTGAQMKYTSFIEFDMTGSKLRSMDATFDSELVTTFLESGRAPRRRK